MRISDWSSDVCSSDLAAGAWADEVAVRAGVAPLGIQPYRRTMLQIATDPAPPPALSRVWGIDGSFYFKPEPGGRLWFSPHDEIGTDPCGPQPEGIDVAIEIDRIERVVAWGSVGRAVGRERGGR